MSAQFRTNEALQTVVNTKLETYIGSGAIKSATKRLQDVFGHDGIIAWKRLLHYWGFGKGINQSLDSQQEPLY